jgi:glycosyltransferase involved in cell wall biosynthesis
MRILQVVNHTVDQVLDGGHARTLALDQWVDSVGGDRIVIQDQRWGQSRAFRYARPVILAREIAEIAPDLLVFRYPACPFFMHQERNADVVRAVWFLWLLRRHALSKGVRLVVDMTDLFRDWGGEKLNDRLLGLLERSVYGSADEVWACAAPMGQYITDKYNLPPDRARTVRNGNFRRAKVHVAAADEVPAGKLSFLYAGDLRNGVRNIQTILDGFVKHVRSADARLVVCGGHGEWIPDAVNDSRVLYLGLLPPEALNAVGERCSMGLIPQIEEGYLHLVEPTKLGLYMTLRLPVLTSRCKAMMAFIEEHKCGLVAPFDAFGEALNRIAEDPQVLMECRVDPELAESFYWDRIYGDALKGFCERFGLKAAA